MTVIQLYSALIASGNSARCQELSLRLRNELLIQEPNTDYLKSDILKFYKFQKPKEFKRIAKELKFAIADIFNDISHIYIKGGNSEIDDFRKILENSMINGKWSGIVSGEIS